MRTNRTKVFSITCIIRTRSGESMAREFAKTFYQSDAWVACRRAYLAKVGGMCERCAAKGLAVPAEIVHHKVPLDAHNIRRPDVALNFDNLMALCRDCHGAVHRPDKRWKVTADGHVIAAPL